VQWTVEMYDEYGNLIIPHNYGRIHFSKVEITQILISVVALTAAFTIVLLGGVFGDIGKYTALDWVFALGVSAVVSVTGFLLHELAHKFVAQYYGAWAEFRMYPTGLLFAVVFAFLGFLFAAPGAVYIQGRINRKQNGLISIAGPATNIVFGTIFIALWLLFPDLGIWSFAFNLIGVLSLFLAGFNLIPLGPLDGKKVFQWNPVAWAVAVIATGIPLLIGWGII
jgi:Zn-dependent protease